MENYLETEAQTMMNYHVADMLCSNYVATDAIGRNYDDDEDAKWFDVIKVRESSHLDKLFAALHENDIQRFIALLDDDDTILNSLHEDLHCSVLMRSLFVKNGEAFTRTLLTYDINIHQKDIYGNSPLHVATQFASVDIMALLLEAGCVMEEADESGDEALHIAAYNSRAEVVRLLIGHGADVDRLNTQGMTAVQVATASSTSCLLTLNELLSAGCSVDPPRMSETSALLQAIWNKDSSVVDLLLSHNANVNCRGRSGSTALEAALDIQDFDLMVRLVCLNAQIYSLDYDGMTRKSLFQLYMCNFSCPNVCKLFLMGGALSSREGWMYNALPQHIMENERTKHMIENFRAVVPTLRELCVVAIREALALTSKFEVAINCLDIPSSLKRELGAIIHVSDFS